MTAHDSEHSLEIERKYDVDESAEIPDWGALPGVAFVDRPERRDLDARYLDTADGRLGRSAIALRRRTGGPDAGWHIKRATPAGKLETRWPLDEAPDGERVVVPDAVSDALALDPELIGLGPVEVIAQIRNERTAYALRDVRGDLVAEFVDDRVHATDVRRGIESRWREWELELGPAGPADEAEQRLLFAAADALVAAAGGSVSASESKLGRALGL